MRDVVAALLLVYAVVIAEVSTRWLPRASACPSAHYALS